MTNKYESEYYTQKNYDFNFNDEIASLNLSVRAENCLRRAGINRVSNLILMSYYELCNIRNLGLKSLREIIVKLEMRGLHIKY